MSNKMSNKDFEMYQYARGRLEYLIEKYGKSDISQLLNEDLDNIIE